jgi:hypothetical protein
MTDWLSLYLYQAANLPMYREYHRLLNRDPQKVNKPKDCLFLPISFFKTSSVLLPEYQSEKTFYSSGTGLNGRSKHNIASLKEYEQSFVACFAHTYGDFKKYRWIALLPSYLENGDSSLIYMVDYFIQQGLPGSAYWLNQSKEELEHLLNEAVPTILIGVTYALISTRLTPENRSHLIVMETGGMKGRGEELTRQQAHKLISQNFGCEVVHSEYGMTELMSQAYSVSEGVFRCPASMQVFIRDPRDPFSYLPAGKSGVINIMDLNNRHSCAFIETSDLGRVHKDGNFEVLGRMDDAELRGCNLLLTT